VSTVSATLVIPSVGAATLGRSLAAVADLDPPPRRTIVVHSGPHEPEGVGGGWELVRCRRRLGFAAAVNLALDRLGEESEHVALVNDDAVVEPRWLATLAAALDEDPRRAAVQGTVVDGSGRWVDGRGITFDRWGLPIQVDRGLSTDDEPAADRSVMAVSATAALYRRSALDEARLGRGTVLDETFGAYHEDLDLGLRLHRLGWKARWVPGAPCRHLGSTSGAAMVWRHPWWLLANRWRALAGNLDGGALLASLPRLLRGELRAVMTLSRCNPRAPLVALGAALALPALILGGLARGSAGPRLGRLPGGC
jgi:GT2 family glycosyltransferase